MKLWVVSTEWKIVCPKTSLEIKPFEETRANVWKFIQQKVDVHIEWEFARRIQMLEEIEKRSEKNWITAELAHTQEWATGWIKKNMDHRDVKAEIMKWEETHFDSRSFQYLALLHRYRQLVNIHYIKESNS